MSSGPFTDTLSAAAAFVIRSLLEHPNRQTPEEIAAPHAGEIDAEGAGGGLAELEARGLAAQDPDGRWQLTDAGRDAQPRA